MDKGLIVKVLVVFLALLFLMEPFAMTVQNWAGNSRGGAASTYTGTANVNATIYSYGAFLYMNAPTEIQKTQISGNPEVLSLEELEGGYYRITLRDSAKTREIYTSLKNTGIDTMAVAQVGLPDTYAIALPNGTKMEISGGYQQLFMEPVLEPGRKISYAITVETDGHGTLKLLDAKSYYYDTELSGEATIIGANSSAYLFTIPWEERDIEIESLKEVYGEENVYYERKDYLVFDPPLSTSETLFMKTGYVTYISEGSASVLENFTNKTQAEQDFMGKAAFPDSILRISSGEEPEGVDFEYELSKTYRISLPRQFGGYLLEAGEVDVPSELDFEVNETVLAKFNATVTGDIVLGARQIYLEKA